MWWDCASFTSGSNNHVYALPWHTKVELTIALIRKASSLCIVNTNNNWQFFHSPFFRSFHSPDFLHSYIEWQFFLFKTKHILPVDEEALAEHLPFISLFPRIWLSSASLCTTCHPNLFPTDFHCIFTAPSFIGPFPPAARFSFWACSFCRRSSLLFFASSALLGLSCPQSSIPQSSSSHPPSGDLLVWDSFAGTVLVRGDSSNDPQSPTSHAFPSVSCDRGGLFLPCTPDLCPATGLVFT